MATAMHCLSRSVLGQSGRLLSRTTMSAARCSGVFPHAVPASMQGPSPLAQHFTVAPVVALPYRGLSSASPAGPVPVIDLAPFFKGDHNDKLAVAKQLGDTCERIGFFSVVNHGVDEEMRSRMDLITRAYFDLPASVKNEIVMSEDYPYGYSGFMEEKLSKGYGDSDAPPDLKECFAIGPYNPKAGMPSIRWPSSPPQFAEVWTEYYKRMEVLADDILQLFALALELPQDWFQDKTTHHRSALRALNYPASDESSEPQDGQMRAGAHTDYGSLTILSQDSVGGLQVVTKSGDWADVPYIPGSFVINIGDLMALWTNEKWVSTIHRVRPVKPRRQSIAFFQNINHDHLVECIPTCQSPDNPPKHEPILAWDHLMKKHLQSVEQGSTY